MLITTRWSKAKQQTAHNAEGDDMVGLFNHIVNEGLIEASFINGHTGWISGEHLYCLMNTAQDVEKPCFYLLSCRVRFVFCFRQTAFHLSHPG